MICTNLLCIPKWRTTSSRRDITSIETLFAGIDENIDKRKDCTVTEESSSFATCILASIANGKFSRKWSKIHEDVDKLKDQELYLNDSLTTSSWTESLTTSSWTESIDSVSEAETNRANPCNPSTFEASKNVLPESSHVMIDCVRQSGSGDISTLSSEEDALTIEFFEKKSSLFRDSFSPKEMTSKIDSPIQRIHEELKENQIPILSLEPQWMDIQKRARTMARSILGALPCTIEAPRKYSDDNTSVSFLTDSYFNPDLPSSWSISSAETQSKGIVEPNQEINEINSCIEIDGTVNDRDGNETGNTDECKAKDESSIKIALNSNKNVPDTRDSFESEDNEDNNFLCDESFSKSDSLFEVDTSILSDTFSDQDECSFTVIV